MSPWILAARPKTLVAGIVPVLLASSWAFHVGSFKLGVLVSALIGALSLQVGTNYVNDAADFLKGADSPERLGPPRMAAMGILRPNSLFWGAGVAFGVAFLSGMYLVQIAGLPILWIGLLSIVFAIAYTAGPYPLAYLGLGDLFVLVFFGLTAVLGTVYAHVGRIDFPSVFLGLSVGTLGVSLIAVNNLRDIPTDEKSGKKTLAVRLGDGPSRIYYGSLFLFAYAFWVPVAWELGTPFAFLPFLAVPIAYKNVRTCLSIQDRRAFNPLLAKTAGFQMAFGTLALFAIAASR